MPAVDLVINVFERTYRGVLDGDVLNAIAQQNRFAFTARVLLINNVEDRADAESRARAAIQRGAIDDFAFVEDHLGAALAKTGLTERDLGKVRHYLDCTLVAVTLPGSPWVLYWDADVRLAEPCDWITPSIDLMDRDRRVLVANPNWVDPTLSQETVESAGDFALGQGFSDQLFLVRRSDFAAPIYRQRCLALLRYPIAHLGAVFEARVDAYMRHHDRLRATYRLATYIHPSEAAGASYPAKTPAEALRALRNRIVLAGLRASPVRPRCCRTL